MDKNQTRRKHVDRAGLMEMVDKAVKKHGGPSAVARVMGLSQPSISQAAKDPRSRNDGMRVRILKELEGVEASEAWEIRKGPKESAVGDSV